jgi:hypothetical protein
MVTEHGYRWLCLQDPCWSLRGICACCRCVVGWAVAIITIPINVCPPHLGLPMGLRDQVYNHIRSAQRDVKESAGQPEGLGW